MHPTRAPGDTTLPLHEQVMRDARAAKRGLDEIIRPLSSGGKDPAAVHSTDYWDRVWQTAHFLRLQADALSVKAQRQGQLLREAAHPANQPPAAGEPSEPPQEGR